MKYNEENLMEQINDHLVTNLPQFFKDFLNDFTQTRFMKSRLLESNKDPQSIARKYEIDNNANYLMLDWKVNNFLPSEWVLTKENISRAVLLFGVDAHYQGDNIKLIKLDMKSRSAHIVTGHAFGQYGSGRRISVRPVQKYFEDRVAAFWQDYEAWLRGVIR